MLWLPIATRSRLRALNIYTKGTLWRTPNACMVLIGIAHHPVHIFAEGMLLIGGLSALHTKDYPPSVKAPAIAHVRTVLTVQKRN